MRFQNGCNKVVIELRFVQFWSEIILVISNRTRAARSFDSEILTQRFRPNCTPLSLITIIYSFTYMKPKIVFVPFIDRGIGAPLLVLYNRTIIALLVLPRMPSAQFFLPFLMLGFNCYHFRSRFIFATI